MKTIIILTTCYMALITGSAFSQKTSPGKQVSFPFFITFECDTLNLFTENMQKVEMGKYKFTKETVINILTEENCVLAKSGVAKNDTSAKSTSLFVACCASVKEYDLVEILVPVTICDNGYRYNDTTILHKSAVKKKIKSCTRMYIMVRASVICYRGCPRRSGCYATYMFQNQLFVGVWVQQPVQPYDRTYESSFRCGCCPETICGQRETEKKN
jgi:hypothetical protein